MRSSVFVSVIVGLGACVAPLDSTPTVEAPVATPAWVEGDALFASGRCSEAILAYDQALLQRLETSDEARTMLFRALARLDCAASGSTQQAFAELRDVERRFPTTIWGGLARVFVDDIIRQEALHQTVARLEARSAALTERIAACEQELEATNTLKDSIQGQLAAAREERRKVQAALDDATEAESQLETRVEELTRELADLKRIDMERDL